MCRFIGSGLPISPKFLLRIKFYSLWLHCLRCQGWARSENGDRNFALYKNLALLHIYLLAFSTQVRGFKPGRSRRIFKGKKIISTPSFGGEVKPSVPCRRFAACKRSLNGEESRHFGKITGQHSRPQFHLPLLGSLASLRHLVAKVGTSKGGESNGKLPLRTSPGCSVPELYQSTDWALVSAQTGPRAEYL